MISVMQWRLAVWLAELAALSSFLAPCSPGPGALQQAIQVRHQLVGTCICGTWLLLTAGCRMQAAYFARRLLSVHASRAALQSPPVGMCLPRLHNTQFLQCDLPRDTSPLWSTVRTAPPHPCSYPWWIWAFLTFMLVLLALGCTTFIGK